ncbi:protein-disulfide reductase DsbD [Rhizobacter sp. SG703]|uniref:protein-disulfide reductase DsbD n=1 Tax=Rhizobacter sp. SG703 TaxID=2587140 RepID=UPI00178D4D2A|nr:protein-disulfide reductase DsbD [Rhizobacter sp. SG703]NKI94682.1 thiol:disulfide interchange protein DsbD [Rhizobacter sp. SG703]
MTMWRWAVSALALLAAPAFAADEFLDPAQAFRSSVQLRDAKTIEVRLDVAPGYHLYRDRITVGAPVVTATGAATLAEPVLPHGPQEYDEGFGKYVETLRGAVTVALPVRSASGDFAVAISYQGCADKGLCYPPQNAGISARVKDGALQQVSWLPEGVPETTATAAVVAAPAAPTAAAPAAAESASGRVESALRSGSLLTVAGVFLVAGLLLSFTPCVLPMVPILSSIIVGTSGPVSRARGFGLALAYSLGMAMVYTALGVAAGLAGEGLAAALQNAWVLGAFALLLALLSLSMFGVYELQMPGAIQEKLNAGAGKLRGGQHVGVFAMGGLSALIVGPCVAAPLAGALVFISQSRDVLIGGLALFSLAAGMSVPLLLVGVSAGSLLPRTGAWMEGVKHLFGVLLLGVALWIVSPVLPSAVVMGIVGAGLLVGAAWLFDGRGAPASGKHRLLRGVALVLGLVGVAQVAGALSGGGDLLQPLARFSGGGGARAAAQAVAEGPSFKRVRSVAELDALLATAGGKPVMLDFYADWCVACKEMEHLTFNQPPVQSRMAGALLLQADVTANSADDKALLKRFGLFGPPGIVFFDGSGREKAGTRVVGFQPAAEFGEALSAAGL